MLYLQGQRRETPDAREHHAELHNGGGSNRRRVSAAAASTISYPREFLPNEVWSNCIASQRGIYVLKRGAVQKSAPRIASVVTVEAARVLSRQERQKWLLESNLLHDSWVWPSDLVGREAYSGIDLQQHSDV